MMRMFVYAGWMVRLGRGLDLYKRMESQFAVGYHDMDLRPCYQSNIDIWQQVKPPS
jgi:ATP-dependent Lon protease